MGLSPESFAPTPNAVLELTHPDDRPVLQQYRRDLAAGRDSYSITVRVIRGDGQLAHIQLWSTAVRASDGSVAGMFGTVQDVTARKQAEVEIAQNRDNLARAETIARLGHYKYDAASGAFTWSEGHYRILGKSRDSFTPTLSSILELVHPDDRPMMEQHRRDVTAGLEAARVTLRWVKDDGQIVVTETLSLPVRASDGAIIGRFGTIQDVTRRTQAEAALARANQELETRVAERTAELAREMRRREEAQMTLAQMQKMEAVGQLTAGIAHDFNNLLAVIGSGLECIERSAAQGLTAEPDLIDASLRATRRGRDLVHRLLAFARQSPLSAEPTSVNQLVLDTLRLLQRTLGEEIDIVTHLDVTAVMVCVDRNQLANALVNLALNARDAMPEGGTLSIATTCQPARWATAEGASRWPTGEEVCIAVQDTGAGMTDDVRGAPANRSSRPSGTVWAAASV